MKPMQGWDKAHADMGGEFERLTPGGHIVKILHAEIGQSQGGREMMIVNFDIDEGSQFDGIFRRAFDRIKKGGSGKAIPRWPNGGTYYQLLEDRDGNVNPRFKGLITAVEQSNSYHWSWDEKTLAGQHVGLIFREEEYMSNNNELRIAVKAIACCPAGEALEKEAPKMKKLEADQPNATLPQSAPTNSGFTQVDDDELPF